MDINEAVETINLESPELYINRELSVLEFNKRVLAQAKNEAVPCLSDLTTCVSPVQIWMNFLRLELPVYWKW